MFDFVRQHTKIMMGVMFLLIIPSFVFFGIQGYGNLREAGEAVASVAGQDISKAEWDEAHRREVDRLRAQMPSIDASAFDTEQSRYVTLERLVQQRVLQIAADKSRLVVGEQRLARDIEQSPGGLSVRRPDGTLDMEWFRQLLDSRDSTDRMYVAGKRAELSARQVLGALIDSNLPSVGMSDAALNAFFQRREVQVARFESAGQVAKVVLTDAALEAYYKANPSQFQAPEQATIEYVTLDLAAVEKSLTVNDADLRTYFEQNAKQWEAKEERRASHILVNAPKSASEAERQKAKARASELLAQVRKAPDSFAEVARKNSQDSGSAPSGGDLDFFGRGAMVKPFEDAVFAMKKGDISELVESEFGFHIIRLTDLRGPRQRGFDELRAEIESTVRKQQAKAKFSEAAETFRNTAYEQPDSLKPVAEKLKLEVNTATLTGPEPAKGAKGALANAKFLKAIFALESTQKKQNIEAMDLGGNQMASGRITSYAPARTLPLAEVRDKVRERLIQVRAVELANKEGSAMLAAWKASPAAANLPPAITLSRDQPQQQPPELVAAVMRADLSTLPAWVGVELGDQGYAVVKINRIAPREALPDERLKQDRSQYADWWAGAEGMAYYKLLKERHKARINVAKPGAETAGG
jgi:peptidyl-prolyl cis-trans isomerase D